MVARPGLADRYGAAATYYQEHLDNLSAGRLAVQQCDSCGYLRWPPGRACPECLADSWHWEQLDGTAVIWSVAVYERSYGSSRQVPYNVVLVDLGRGVRMLSTVTGADSRELRPGMPVTASFDGTGPGLARLVFRPVPAGTGQAGTEGSRQ